LILFFLFLEAGFGFSLAPFWVVWISFCMFHLFHKVFRAIMDEGKQAFRLAFD
jgi:hypothetical protein